MIAGPQLSTVGRGRAALRAQKVDPLLRGRDRHYIFRRTQRVRPGAVRGRENEPHARVTASIRIGVQQLLVCAHGIYSIPEQEGPV